MVSSIWASTAKEPLANAWHKLGFNIKQTYQLDYDKAELLKNSSKLGLSEQEINEWLNNPGDIFSEGRYSDQEIIDKVIASEQDTADDVQEDEDDETEEGPIVPSVKDVLKYANECIVFAERYEMDSQFGMLFESFRRAVCQKQVPRQTTLFEFNFEQYNLTEAGVDG